MQRIWIEAGAGGCRVLGEYADGRVRALRRTNTLLAAEAELLGLARRRGLRVTETAGGSVEAAAERAGVDAGAG
ncbi:MAG: hypothetical protein H6842_09985 [Rhodospirillaceae bacterium]|nr:hypothetical protein [Rhodospirillaceae bacterium]